MTLAAEAQLDRVLAGSPTRGSFFLHGDATRLRDEAVGRLIDATLDPSTRDFNLDRFRADDLEPEMLAATLAMPPMMAEARVVTLSDAQKLGQKARDIVLSAAESAPEGLVFIVSATIPANSKAAFYRKLVDRCLTIEFCTPRESEIPGWLLERAREAHGFGIDRDAAQALAAAIGADLSILDAELAKLATAADGGRLGLETVRELVPNLRRMDRWTWLDLVADRKYEEALAELEGVLAGDRAVGLLAGLIEHHLFLGLAVEGGVGLVKKTLAETGRGYLGWKASVYARQAGRWSAGQVRSALDRMYRADRQAKSGGTDRGVLEELLLGLRIDRAGAP